MQSQYKMFFFELLSELWDLAEMIKHKLIPLFGHNWAITLIILIFAPFGHICTQWSNSAVYFYHFLGLYQTIEWKDATQSSSSRKNC